MRWPLFLLLLVPAIQDPPQESALARARAKFEEAQNAEKAGGDFDTPGKAALAAFNEAVKADAKSIEALAGRGEFRATLAAWRFPRGDFSKRAEFEAAIADFDEAIKLDPRRADSYAGRGFARSKLAVARMFARGDIDELFKTAFEDLDKALELRPADAGLLILRGDAHYEKAVYARFRADPHRPPAEKALEDYREAVRLESGRAALVDSRIASAGKLADSPVAVDDKGPSIVWSKSWELAKREAQVRRVPIFFYVSGGAG